MKNWLKLNIKIFMLLSVSCIFAFSACFWVFSATEISYNIGGSIEYVPQNKITGLVESFQLVGNQDYYCSGDAKPLNLDFRNFDSIFEVTIPSNVSYKITGNASTYVTIDGTRISQTTTPVNGYSGTLTCYETNNPNNSVSISFTTTFTSVTDSHDYEVVDSTTSDSYTNVNSSQHQKTTTTTTTRICTKCNDEDIDTSSRSVYENHNNTTSTSYGSWGSWEYYNGTYHRRYRDEITTDKCTLCTYSHESTESRKDYEQESHSYTRTLISAAYNTSTSWGSWSDWTTTREATCTTDGEKERSRTGTYYHYTAKYRRTCSGCGDSYTTGGTRSTRTETDYDTEVIEAPGHNYSYTTIIEATCTINGSRRGTCTVCGDIITVTIPAGHLWYDTGLDIMGPSGWMSIYKCRRCNAQEFR